MDMNVGAMGMIDQPSIKNVGALMFADSRLRMDAEMQTIKVVDAITETFVHRNQETAQSVRFVSAFDLYDPRIFNGESNRFGEVRGYADVT